MKPALTIDALCNEAKTFAEIESSYFEPTLFGVTDGQAIGTYLEHKFQNFLHNNYEYVEGSSAKGIDFPDLNVDMAVTRITQPQSFCPFKSAKQKIYGLDYSLLIFVYDKEDNANKQAGCLNILHTIFVESHRTADYQTTSSLHKILDNNGNIDDIFAFLSDRYLPVDEAQAIQLAKEILNNRPQLGYLTIFPFHALRGIHNMTLHVDWMLSSTGENP